MNENAFIEAVSDISKEYGFNPLLLMSGIEGLYTFRDVTMNTINYDLLDSLILTVFALRVGDQFHTLAEENLSSKNANVQLAAINELTEITAEEIETADSPYLKSFASLLGGKSPVRRYHLKALEVAAVEIKKAQLHYNNESIGMIILAICKTDTQNRLGLASLFNPA